MLDPSAIASLVSTLLNGLSFLLSELRQREKGDASSEEVRAALLQLEEYLAAWADQAVTTNESARVWADAVPETGDALSTVIDTGMAQSMYVADVESALGQPVDLIPPSFARDLGGQPTLKRVLRVYAPEFFELLVVFSQRKQQLLAMTDELDRRYAEGGRNAVDEYLLQLEGAAEGLQEARRRLAEFIASEFPLSSGQEPPRA